MITTENKKAGWLDRLKNGLHRTRVNIIGLFTGGKVDEDFLEELEFALISADVQVTRFTNSGSEVCPPLSV